MQGEVKWRPRFRFSLSSLLLAVTFIAAVLGYLKLKSIVMHQDNALEPLRNAAQLIPVSTEWLFFSAQLASALFVIAVIYYYRRPRLLWLYLATQITWFLLILIFFLLRNVTHLGTRIGDAMLIGLFFQPAIGLVTVVLAWCLVVAKRQSRRTLVMTGLLLLTLLCELSATLALDEFVGAIAAAIALSRV